MCVRKSMEKRDDILLSLIPESEKAYFENRERKAKQVDIKDGQKGLAETLMMEFVNDDGTVLTPKDIIDRKAIGFVMANPSPQNVKALYELAGLAAPKEIDVKSGGKPIDKFLSDLSIKQAANGEN